MAVCAAPSPEAEDVLLLSRLPALCRPLDIGLPDAGFMALPPAEAVEAPLAEDASVEPVNPPAVGIVPSA